jgi:hypothetical protein
VTQAEGIRSNFLRFLADEILHFDDLVVEQNGVQVPLTLEMLEDISTYSLIRHREGKTIRMASNYDFRRFDFSVLEHQVGVAFSLGYYGRGFDEPATLINADGFQVSSFYMPGWRGIRDVPLKSKETQRTEAE